MRSRRCLPPVVAVLALVASACASGGGGGAPSRATTTVGGRAVSVSSADTAIVASGSDLTFYVITDGIDGPFWSVVRRGAQQAGTDLAVNVVYEESNADAQLQAQMIEAAIAHEPAGIAISLADPPALAEAAKAVLASKIPLYTLNSGVNDYRAIGAVTHVGQDEILAGERAGDRLAELGATSVLCARQQENNVGLGERCDGLANTFKGMVRSEFVGVETDPALQEAEMAALLEANPDIDSILATGPNVTRSAIGAAETVGRKTVIGGFDLTPDLIAAIKAGTLAFTVDQEQYLQGYLPVVLMYLQATNLNTVGGGLPVLTGPSFVDRDNVDRVSALVDQGTH
jgi:simple sugar transport system substrate-binding protein